MEEFLQYTKSILMSGNDLPRVHVVLGDNKCDLDSAVSTLAYAYFLYKTQSTDDLYVPVLNIQRSEFPLRTEVVLVLQQLNIPDDSLIFRDEIDLHFLNREGKLTLTLVDHNMLTSDDKALETAIIKIIDHHDYREQERFHSTQCEIVLEPVGSCSTLIVSEILQEAPDLLNEQLTHLFRGAIILDCMNMTSEAGKVTLKDEEMLAALEQKFPDLPAQQEIFDTLQQAKFDVSGFNTEQVLLRDLKELSEGDTKLAISTVCMTLEAFLSRPNVVDNLKVFTGRHGYDILVLMTSFLNEGGEAVRQVAIYTDNYELCNRICNTLEECQSPCLQLLPIEYGLQEIRAYQQGSSSVSCKQMLPLIKDCIYRRQQEMIMNRRTSSTEAVNGSAPVSEGSSGALDLSGPDVDSQNTEYIGDNSLENSQNLNSSLQAHGDGNFDLMSPDSGLATIRSNRSSKESSVFLSDESPIREAVVPPSSIVHGYDMFGSLPEDELAEEKIASVASMNDNFDLSVLDPSHCTDTHAGVTANNEGFLSKLDSAPQKKIVEDVPLNCNWSKPSTEISEETSPEADLVKAEDVHVYKQGSASDKSGEDQMLRQVVRSDVANISLLPQNLSDDIIGSQIEHKNVPPTPMNSLVDGSPLVEGPHNIFAEDVIEKMNEIVILDADQSDSMHTGEQKEFEISAKQNVPSSKDIWNENQNELNVLEQSPDFWTDFDQEFSQSNVTHCDIWSEIGRQSKQSVMKNVDDQWNITEQSIFQSTSAEADTCDELDKSQLSSNTSNNWSKSVTVANLSGIDNFDPCYKFGTKNLIVPNSLNATTLLVQQDKQQVIDSSHIGSEQKQYTAAIENTCIWSEPVHEVIRPHGKLPDISKDFKQKTQQLNTENRETCTESIEDAQLFASQMPTTLSDSELEINLPVAVNTIIGNESTNKTQLTGEIFDTFDLNVSNLTSESEKLRMVKHVSPTTCKHDLEFSPEKEKRQLTIENTDFWDEHFQESNAEIWNIALHDPERPLLSNSNLLSKQINSINQASQEGNETEQAITQPIFETTTPSTECVQEGQQATISCNQAGFEMVESLNPGECKQTSPNTSVIWNEFEHCSNSPFESLEGSDKYIETISQQSAETLDKMVNSDLNNRYSSTENPYTEDGYMQESSQLSTGIHHPYSVFEEDTNESTFISQELQFKQVQEFSQPTARQPHVGHDSEIEGRLPDYKFCKSSDFEMVEMDNQQTSSAPQTWNQLQQEDSELNEKISNPQSKCEEFSYSESWDISRQKTEQPVLNIVDMHCKEQGSQLLASEIPQDYLAGTDTCRRAMEEDKLQAVKNADNFHESDFEFIQATTDFPLSKRFEQEQSNAPDSNRSVEDEYNRSCTEIPDTWIDSKYEFPKLLPTSNDARTEFEQELVEQNENAPDIVNDYHQDAHQISSANPDLWAKSDHLFFDSTTVNPDILNDHELDSSHSTPNSPDKWNELVEAEKQELGNPGMWMVSEGKPAELKTELPDIMDVTGQQSCLSISDNVASCELAEPPLNDQYQYVHNELVQQASHSPLVAVDSQSCKVQLNNQKETKHADGCIESGEDFVTEKQTFDKNKDLTELNQTKFDSVQEDEQQFFVRPDAWIQFEEDAAEAVRKDPDSQGKYQERIRYYDLENHKFTQDRYVVAHEENLQLPVEEIPVSGDSALLCENGISWGETKQFEISGAENNVSCIKKTHDTPPVPLQDESLDSFQQTKEQQSSISKDNHSNLYQVNNSYSKNDGISENEHLFSKSRCADDYFTSATSSYSLDTDIYDPEMMEYFSVSEENILNMEPLRDFSQIVTDATHLNNAISSPSISASKIMKDELVTRQKTPKISDEGSQPTHPEVQSLNRDTESDIFEDAFVHGACESVRQPDSLKISTKVTEDRNMFPPADGTVAQPNTDMSNQSNMETEQVVQNVLESAWLSFGNANSSSNSNETSCSLSSSIHKSDFWEDLSPQDCNIVPEGFSHVSVSESAIATVRHKEMAGSEVRLETAEKLSDPCSKRSVPLLEQRFDNQYSSLVSSLNSPVSCIEIGNEVDNVGNCQTQVNSSELCTNDFSVTSDKDHDTGEMDYIIVAGSKRPREEVPSSQQTKSLAIDLNTDVIKKDFEEDDSSTLPSAAIQPRISGNETSNFERFSGILPSANNAPDAQFIGNNDQNQGGAHLDETPTKDQQSGRIIDLNELSDTSPEEYPSRTEMSESGSEHSIKELKTTNLVSNETSADNTEGSETDYDAMHHRSSEIDVIAYAKRTLSTDELSDSETESTASQFSVREANISHEDLSESEKVAEQNYPKPSATEHSALPEKELRREKIILTEKGDTTEVSSLNSIQEYAPQNCKAMAQDSLQDPVMEVKGTALYEEYARSVSEDVGMDIPFEGVLSPLAEDSRPAPPNSLDLNGIHQGKKKLTAPDISLSLDQSEGSVLSDNLDTPDDLDINVDDLETPDEADSLEYTGHGNELEWEDETPSATPAGKEVVEPIPEYTAEEERTDNRLWRTVVIGEQEHRIDMKAIEPYRRVVSHGGYYSEGLNAIIVFAACFLPESSRPDYNHIMENLFLYVISTLELLVAEDYMIIYLNGATPRRKMPGFSWMKRCYQMIDRRLRKNLKSFIIVHPSWFIRTILAVTRPFISSKFSSKVRYVSSLAELEELIPMQHVQIPETIRKLDEELKEASEAAKASRLSSESKTPTGEQQVETALNKPVE
ncbi:uncharacterized protein LOC125450743 isoform X2 [Stegostoma tigrinum]|uniref:uncharacterized protein LOC125450743 isoform X2 n=1 Tax=Stegostoma tigrinum TaxID=3053191 RepID=UPI00286FD5F8|nr:uncharacterized protein LOC125450743 isoform X2 [Stegostoma tigrinum]